MQWRRRDGIEFLEIPFGRGGGKDIAGIDIETREQGGYSFMNAILRSRWVFSITLAASAT